MTRIIIKFLTHPISLIGLMIFIGVTCICFKTSHWGYLAITCPAYVFPFLGGLAITFCDGR